VNKFACRLIAAAGATALMSGAAIAQSTSWAGTYVGGSLGWTAITTDFKDPGNNFNTGANLLGDGQQTKTGLGLFTGYNVQSGTLVYGVELAADIRKLETTGPNADMGSGHNQLRTTSRSAYSIKGRLGTVVGKYLVYGAAGPVFSKFDVFNEDHGVFGRSSSTKTGLALAVGFETMVSNKLALRVQAEHQMFKAAQVTNSNGDNFEAKSSTTSASVGVSYKF
jgi:outer membrane immunogenic protein